MTGRYPGGCCSGVRRGRGARGRRGERKKERALRAASTCVDNEFWSTYVDDHERTGRDEAGGVGRQHRPRRRAAGRRLAAHARGAPRGAARQTGARAGLVVAGDRRRPRRQQAGGPPQARRGPAARKEGGLMFERVTDSARPAVLGARGHAVPPHPHWIGTEHLLLGLLDDADGRAARVLRDRFALDGEWARGEVERIVGRGEPGIDADALATLGIDLDAVRERVERTFGAGALSGRRRGRRCVGRGGGGGARRGGGGGGGGGAGRDPAGGGRGGPRGRRAGRGGRAPSPPPPSPAPRGGPGGGGGGRRAPEWRRRPSGPRVWV